MTALFVVNVSALHVASNVRVVTLVTCLSLSPVFITLAVTATFSPFNRFAFCTLEVDDATVVSAVSALF